MRLLFPCINKFVNRNDVRLSIKFATMLSSHHLTPEIKLHLITSDCKLWKSDARECSFMDPYWAFYWAGGQALARFILDNRDTFYAKSIIDIGSGCGACGIAAALCKAKYVISNDLDQVACEVVAMNCSINNVKVHIQNSNLINKELPFPVNILLVGDMFYDSNFGNILFEWLLKCKKNGIKIFVGDPGRHAFDNSKMEQMTLIKEYSLLPHTVLENNGFKSSYVWEM